MDLLIEVGAGVGLLFTVFATLFCLGAVRFDDGTWGPGAEVLDWVMYDRVLLANARTESLIFNATVGDTRNGVALTDADTNNLGGRALPVRHKFTIWSVEFFYQAIAIRDNAAIQSIVDLFRNTVVRFNIDGKDLMFHTPLWYWNSAFQVQHVPSVAGDNVQPPGYANYQGVWTLKVPIVLQELTPWFMQVNESVASAAAIDGDFLAFGLRGELDRSH